MILISSNDPELKGPVFLIMTSLNHVVVSDLIARHGPMKFSDGVKSKEITVIQNWTAGQVTIKIPEKYTDTSGFAQFLSALSLTEQGMMI